MKTYIYRVDYRLAKLLEKYPYMEDSAFGNNPYVYFEIQAKNAFEAYETLVSATVIPRDVLEYVLMISRKERVPSTKWWKTSKLPNGAKVYYM